MVNLGFFEVNTNGEYQTIEEVTGLTFTTGTKYSLQVQNGGGFLTICPSATLPTEGGVVLKDLEKFDYTPVQGVNLYLKTAGFGTVNYLNIIG